MCIYKTLWLKARAIVSLISSVFHLPGGQDSVKFSDTGQESRLRSLDTVCFERISICELAVRVMDKTLWNLFDGYSALLHERLTTTALHCNVVFHAVINFNPRHKTIQPRPHGYHVGDPPFKCTIIIFSIEILMKEKLVIFMIYMVFFLFWLKFCNTAYAGTLYS